MPFSSERHPHGLSSRGANRRAFLRETGRFAKLGALAGLAYLAQREMEKSRPGDTSEYRYERQRDEIEKLVRSVVDKAGPGGGPETSIVGGGIRRGDDAAEYGYSLSVANELAISVRRGALTENFEVGGKAQIKQYLSQGGGIDWLVQRNPEGTLTVMTRRSGETAWRTVDDTAEKYFRLREANDRYVRALVGLDRALSQPSATEKKPSRTRPASEARRRLLDTLKSILPK